MYLHVTWYKSLKDLWKIWQQRWNIFASMNGLKHLNITPICNCLMSYSKNMTIDMEVEFSVQFSRPPDSVYYNVIMFIIIYLYNCILSYICIELYIILFIYIIIIIIDNSPRPLNEAIRVGKLGNWNMK